MQKKYKFNTTKIKYVFAFLLFSVYNVTAQTLRINEVVSSNSIHTDEDGDTPDWLEIHNYGNQDVSINGWSLSDDANDLTQWTFPNITVRPNEYMLLWASSKDRTTINYPRTLINQGDEYKYLLPTSEPNSNWNTLNFDDSSWSAGISGFGYSDGDDATIIPNGTEAIYLRKTFTINNLSVVSSLILDMDYDDGFVAYINGNEVARANIRGTRPTFNSGTITDREAEMYEGGTAERFLISDFNSFLIEGENILTIQAHNVSARSSDFTIIPFLSVVFSAPSTEGIIPPAILNLTTNNLHTNFKISSSSETLILTDASGTIVNQILAENLLKNTSIGISVVSGELVSYSETTPGSMNSSQEFLGSVQNKVVFSHEGGLINTVINLVLSGNSTDEVIRYTTDGTTPTETATIYSSPIQIDDTTNINAQIFRENYLPSPVFTASYVLNTNISTFTDSNLPIVLIVTDNGATIPNDPRVFASMKIIERPDTARNFLTDADNEDFIDYSGTISIETRGSSSQTLPKKPYGFTTLSKDRLENDNVKLLGMPSENDWILNSFAFDDAMMRDYISYEIAREMNQYAVNLKYCEVVLNGEYIGLYALSEKVKIDSDRVAIEKIAQDENSLPELSGGYLLQTDRPTAEDPQAWSNNGAGYIIEKPNADKITSQQASYIEGVFRSLDQNANNANTTNGYPSIIDIPSFIDYILLAEITSNADAYVFSTYFHKDRGGKLRAGPIWDYNLTFGNDLFNTFDTYFDRSLTNVWQYKYSNKGSNIWGDLFNNPTFNCYLSKRFSEVTNTGSSLNYAHISSLIDTTVALISEAVIRENEKWNTITDFSTEITNMKTWLQQRISWMENNLGSFSNCNAIETPSLVITKIDYNPQETAEFTESNDLEFIEIKNTGTATVNLTGIYLAKLGTSYQFPANRTIKAKESIQLASNSDVFQKRYGKLPFGVFQRNLSNKSHNLVLVDAFGNTIDEVAYADKNPWPETADGDGFYLELMDENSDNSLASNWTASTNPVLHTTNFSNDKVKFSVYPNPTDALVKITSEEKMKSVEIFNPLGQKIKAFQVDFNSGEINIGNLKKGAYFLKVTLINDTSFASTIFKK